MRCSAHAVLALLLSVFSAYSAQAYPHYIGYGYSSCLTCHYNPEGGGPLTDYGRALSAGTLTDRPPFISSAVTDDALGEYSGFLGKVDHLPDWLRLQGNYRGMWMTANIESHPTKRWINMQAEGNIVLQFFEDHRLYFVGTLGYIPPPIALQPDQARRVSTFISREHYGAYRIQFDEKNSLGFYAGFMDPVFGIRVPDHNDYLRSMTFLNQNDQTHAIMLHYSGEKFEAAVQGMAGSFYQDASVRPVGVTMMGEYEVAQNLRAGASYWHSSSNFRGRNMGALHARIGYPEGNAVLAEVGLIGDQPTNQPGSTQGFGFLQNSIRMSRGFNFLTTLEFYTADELDSAPRSFRFGPTLQYLTSNHLELRLDVLDTRQTGSDFGTPDSFTVLSQVHVWF